MLFKEIDKEQTKKKVHELLSEFRSMDRLSDDDYRPSITSSFSLEPRSSNYKTDEVGEMVTRKVTAEQELLKITKAINKLPEESRRLLQYRYVVINKSTDKQIYDRLAISESTYYRELEKSMIYFAEAYDNGRLLVEL